MSEYIAKLENENDYLRELLMQAYVKLRCVGGMNETWFDRAADVLNKHTDDPFVDGEIK